MRASTSAYEAYLDARIAYRRLVEVHIEERLARKGLGLPLPPPLPALPVPPSVLARRSGVDEVVTSASSPSAGARERASASGLDAGMIRAAKRASERGYVVRPGLGKVLEVR